MATIVNKKSKGVTANVTSKKRKKLSVKKTDVIVSKRLSNSEERVLVAIAAKKASSRAVRISKALQLPIQYIVDGKLVEKSSNGELKELKKIVRLKSNIDLKKGVKICLKPRG